MANIGMKDIDLRAKSQLDAAEKLAKSIMKSDDLNDYDKLSQDEKEKFLSGFLDNLEEYHKAVKAANDPQGGGGGAGGGGPQMPPPPDDGLRHWQPGTRDKNKASKNSNDKRKKKLVMGQELEDLNDQINDANDAADQADQQAQESNAQAGNSSNSIQDMANAAADAADRANDAAESANDIADKMSDVKENAKEQMESMGDQEHSNNIGNMNEIESASKNAASAARKARNAAARADDAANAAQQAVDDYNNATSESQKNNAMNKAKKAVEDAAQAAKEAAEAAREAAQAGQAGKNGGDKMNGQPSSNIKDGGHKAGEGKSVFDDDGDSNNGQKGNSGSKSGNQSSGNNGEGEDSEGEGEDGDFIAPEKTEATPKERHLSTSHNKVFNKEHSFNGGDMIDKETAKGIAERAGQPLSGSDLENPENSALDKLTKVKNKIRNAWQKHSSPGDANSPIELIDILGNLFPEPVVDWRDVVKEFMTDRVPTAVRRTISRPRISSMPGTPMYQGRYMNVHDIVDEEFGSLAQVFFLVDASGSMGFACGDGKDVFEHIMSELLELEEITQVKRSAYTAFNAGGVERSDIIEWSIQDAPTKDEIKEYLPLLKADGGTSAMAAMRDINEYTDVYNYQTEPYTLMVIVTDAYDNYENAREIMDDIQLENTIILVTENDEKSLKERKDYLTKCGFMEDHILLVNTDTEWGCKESYKH